MRWKDVPVEPSRRAAGAVVRSVDPLAPDGPSEHVLRADRAGMFRAFVSREGIKPECPSEVLLRRMFASPSSVAEAAANILRSVLSDAPGLAKALSRITEPDVTLYYVFDIRRRMMEALEGILRKDIDMGATCALCAVESALAGVLTGETDPSEVSDILSETLGVDEDVLSGLAALGLSLEDVLPPSVSPLTALFPVSLFAHVTTNRAVTFDGIYKPLESLKPGDPSLVERTWEKLASELVKVSSRDWFVEEVYRLGETSLRLADVLSDPSELAETIHRVPADMYLPTGKLPPEEYDSKWKDTVKKEVKNRVESVADAVSEADVEALLEMDRTEDVWKDLL